MNELHIHEVLNMMIETQKTYNDRAEFVKDITERFGADARFYACSSSDMNANEAFDFLIGKGKIVLDDKQAVNLNPNMTMCDDDHHH